MNKNRIGCNVKTCVYNTQCECTAEKIEVGCDECVQPCCDHETLCRTFKKKACLLYTSMRQSAVVGDQKQTFGINIQPSDRK